ncbi:hypothetical protein PM8797T_16942 [Gimesia maris DSM 8797]|nr:hypothetical protein PM8797T_16942 [Gimesia maris DSM 8797]
MLQIDLSGSRVSLTHCSSLKLRLRTVNAKCIEAKGGKYRGRFLMNFRKNPKLRINSGTENREIGRED